MILFPGTPGDYPGAAAAWVPEDPPVSIKILWVRCAEARDRSREEPGAFYRLVLRTVLWGDQECGGPSAQEAEEERGTLGKS